MFNTIESPHPSDKFHKVENIDEESKVHSYETLEYGFGTATTISAFA